MLDAAAGPQHLDGAGRDDGLRAGGVLVVQLALEHPRHDLEVAVRVQVEAGARVEQVLVVQDERSERGVARVVVPAGGQRVPRGDPGVGRHRPVVGPVDGGAHGASLPERSWAGRPGTSGRLPPTSRRDD